jgi:hypothetical protein
LQINLAKKIGVFNSLRGNFAEKVIVTLVVEKNAKILAANCDHNIGHCCHSDKIITDFTE